MTKVKNFIKVFFGLPLTLVAFFFVGKILFDSRGELLSNIHSADFFLLLPGVFFMLMFFFVRGLVWVKVLEIFGENDKDELESIYHYSLAETKRYIPGNIFSFISRIQKFTNEKLSRRTIIKALFLEGVVVSFSALILSLPALLSFFKTQNTLVIALISSLIFVLLIVLFKINTKARTFLLKLFPDKNAYSYINLIFLYSLGWLFFGIGSYFISTSIFPSSPNTIWIFSSIFILSWLVGYVSFIFPMGLGVREATLAYLMLPFFPLYIGTAMAVFTRIVFILSEVIFLLLAFILQKNSKYFNAKGLFNSFLPVTIASFIYTIYFIFFSISKHLNFYSGKFDLGNMENTVWNTVNGRFFIYSNPDGVGELSRLSAHADFILLLFAPFYAIYPSVNLFLVTQTVVIALGGYFVYLIACKVIKSTKIAIILSIGYYLNVFVQEQNLFDFHSVSLATTFLLAAFYFLMVKRNILALTMLILAVLTKENVYLVASVFGGFLFLQGRKFIGGVVFLISLSLFYLLMSYFIPNARSGDHFALSYLSYLGNTPSEIILSPVLKPVEFFSRLFSVETLNYIKLVFMPVGYLSFLSPLYLIFLVPDFLINIMSDNPNLRSIQYHYGALIVPFVYISAIYGIRKILSLRLNFINTDTVFYYLLVFILTSTWFLSPIPGTKNADVSAFAQDSNRSLVYSEISKIPQDKSVSATNNIAAHLVQREKIYVIPYGIEEVDYLVFYKNNFDLMERLLAYSSEYVIQYKDQNLVILKRVNLREKEHTL